MTSDPTLTQFSPALCESIKADPALAAYNYFGLRCWSKQQEILESVFKRRKTLAHTGHAIGKTKIVPVIVALWLLSHPYSYVIISAASWSQIKNKIFPALYNLIKDQQHPVFNTLPMAQEWKIDKGWLAIGLSPDKPEPIQGYHSDGKPGFEHLAGTLAIIDEASGLSMDIYHALIALLTSKNDHIALLGNPIHADGVFAEIITEWSDVSMKGKPGAWNIIHVSSLDSPNIKAGREIIPNLASEEWLIEARHIYREGTPEWSSRVLGLVPNETDETLIPLSSIMAAEKRPVCVWREDGPLRMAVDVAYSHAGDESVIVIGGRTSLHHCWEKRGLTEPELQGHVLELCIKFEGYLKEVIVDYTGVGAGLVHNLKEVAIPGSPRIIPFIAAGVAHNPKLYANSRAEMWFNLRDEMDMLCIPPQHVKKFRECAQIKQKIQKQTGRRLMEDKTEFKKRNGHSPDHGDSLAMLYMEEAGESAFAVSGEVGGNTLTPRYQLQSEPRIIVGEKLVVGEGGVFETVKEYKLHLEGYDHGYDRQGVLVRACYYDRRGSSGCVWAHIDNEGCWSVYKSCRVDFNPLRDYWEVVQALSQSDRYSLDVFSSHESEPTTDYRLYNDLLSIERQRKGNGNITGKSDYNIPQYVSGSRIKGDAGAETINSLLLSTLARFPDDPYWRGDITKADQWLKPEMLVVWPKELVDEIDSAKLRDVKEWRTEDMVDKPNDFIGGGGSLVRALRLLVVCGGMYLGGRKETVL